MGRGVRWGIRGGRDYLPVPFEENRELRELLDEMGIIDGRR